jgi:hypothetical protein
MPYANLLTLPSSFPLPEVEQARRAWVSRSLICLGLCLGLCLVFITTVSIAPIGPLGRHFTDGLHTYLERRQASTAEPRERRTEQVSVRLGEEQRTTLTCLISRPCLMGLI